MLAHSLNISHGLELRCFLEIHRKSVCNSAFLFSRRLVPSAPIAYIDSKCVSFDDDLGPAPWQPFLYLTLCFLSALQLLSVLLLSMSSSAPMSYPLAICSFK